MLIASKVGGKAHRARAFAKSVEAFADELKPTTQNLKPINAFFLNSIEQ
jgi:hypothetical protein